MNIETLTCPKCGAPLHFDNPDQEFCFCSHCGIQVYKENDRIRLEEKKIDAQAELDKKMMPIYMTICGIAIAGFFIFAICVAIFGG